MSFHEMSRKDLPVKSDDHIEMFVSTRSKISFDKADSDPYTHLLKLGLKFSLENASSSFMQDKRRFLLSDAKKNHLLYLFMKSPSEVRHGFTWKIYEHVPDERRGIGAKNPMDDFLKDLSKSSVDNHAILHTMQKFLRAKTTCGVCLDNQHSGREVTVADQGKPLPCPECSGQEGNVQVFITETTGNVATLHVQPLGLQLAREVLRTQGGLEKNNKKSVQGHESGPTPKMILAASEHYILRMHLQAGVFNLQLHHTDDILKTANGFQEPNPIVQVSHSFHTMDKLVEETQYVCRNQSVGVPVTTARDCVHVVGLLAVTQALLRQNMAAQSLRTLGHNPQMQSYESMPATGITSVLRAMLLKTDDKRVSHTINRVHKGSVVTYSESVALPMNATECNSKLEEASHEASAVLRRAENIRVHYSSALSYGIAHQNPGIRSLLNYSAGLDMGCATVALLSGVSFCHSCAYKSAPSINIQSSSKQCLGGVHFINASDFDKVSYETAREMIDSHLAQTLSTNNNLQWCRVRHNFEADWSPQSDPDNGGISCHVLASGMLFFRRDNNYQDSVIGALYVPPKIVPSSSHAKPPSAAEPTNISEKKTFPTKTALDKFSTCQRTHAVQDPYETASICRATETISILASQNLPCTQSLLHNATTMLFHINSICRHAKQYKCKRDEHHLMMRHAWLHTNTLHAVRICGGIKNVEFVRTYSHLSSLANLPLENVGFWSTIPYV